MCQKAPSTEYSLPLMIYPASVLPTCQRKGQTCPRAPSFSVIVKELSISKEQEVVWITNLGAILTITCLSNSLIIANFRNNLTIANLANILIIANFSNNLTIINLGNSSVIVNFSNNLTIVNILIFSI